MASEYCQWHEWSITKFCVVSRQYYERIVFWPNIYSKYGTYQCCVYQLKHDDDDDGLIYSLLHSIATSDKNNKKNIAHFSTVEYVKEKKNIGLQNTGKCYDPHKYPHPHAEAIVMTVTYVYEVKRGKRQREKDLSPNLLLHLPGDWHTYSRHDGVYHQPKHQPIAWSTFPVDKCGPKKHFAYFLMQAGLVDMPQRFQTTMLMGIGDIATCCACSYIVFPDFSSPVNQKKEWAARVPQGCLVSQECL